MRTSGLTVRLDDQLRVTGLNVSGEDSSVRPEPLVTLCDVASEKFVVPTVAPTDAFGALDFGAAQTTGRLAIRADDLALRFSCNLKGADLPARGMLLRFAFPFDAEGWQWHDDMQTARPIAGAARFENVEPLRAWADLPEWANEPDLRMGYSSRNFAQCSPAPWAFALRSPWNRPCCFRTAYDGLTAGIDYNLAHLATSDAPALWDPVAKKPFLNNFFSSCKFARAAVEMLRPRGKITVMNGAIGSSCI